jgi:manganese/iron transport system substrate-binding protein
MKKTRLYIFLYVIILAMIVIFWGCSNQTKNASFIQITTPKLNFNNHLPHVVVTTSILCDLTKQVARETINLSCLIPPNTDPHTYQPKPEDSQALKQAKLIFYHGYNLEPGLMKIIQGTKTKISASQYAVHQLHKFRKNGQEFVDPHLWHNAKNTIKIVQVISHHLGKLVPHQAKFYHSNAERIIAKLNRLDSWIKSRIASIPSKNRKLVTAHDAMGYYVKAYGLAYAGALQGISTQEKPTEGRMKNLFKDIQKYKVATIFAETTINPNLLEPIAKQAKVKVFPRKLYTDGLGEPGSDGETYEKMMTANTRMIVEGLGGTYLKFELKAFDPRP